MTRLLFISLGLFLFTLPACVHSLSMHSLDGEKLSGRYRFAREGTGLIRVAGSDGEILTGKFLTVGRSSFVESYRNIFGSESISVHGADASAYGNAFGAAFASSYAITESAHGESFNASGKSGNVVSGPLFYWTASLQGNKGTTMQCFFIGSSYTGHGLGKCKSDKGKEYSAEF